MNWFSRCLCLLSVFLVKYRMKWKMLWVMNQNGHLWYLSRKENNFEYIVKLKTNISKRSTILIFPSSALEHDGHFEIWETRREECEIMDIRSPSLYSLIFTFNPLLCCPLDYQRPAVGAERVSSNIIELVKISALCHLNCTHNVEKVWRWTGINILSYLRSSVRLSSQQASDRWWYGSNYSLRMTSRY